MVLGLAVPIGTYLFRLFVVFQGAQKPIDLFFYEIHAHPSIYLGMTIASTLILTALGFYIGAAKDWLSQQNESLVQRYDSYEAFAEKKLGSVRLLAAGIAHDFNNLLNSTVGNLEFAKMSVSREGEIYEHLTAAETALLSAKTLTRQLFSFSKDEALFMTAPSVAQLVRDVTHFTLMGSNVRCDVSIPSDLSAVDILEGQMTRVINNLIINAQHAMPEGGTIKISAEDKLLRPEDGLALPTGSYVKFIISDHGTGIPKDQLDRIFNPSFTTKAGGKGLGLANVHSIITQNNGCVMVKSQEKVGTTFDIFLPASQKDIPAFCPAVINEIRH